MILLAAFLLLAADPVEQRYSPAYQRCLDAPAGQTTAGMVQCISAEIQVQDAALNRAYQKTMAGLNGQQRTNLQKAQRAWIAFREADCGAVYDPDAWGSISRINSGTCVLRMTVERTIYLEGFPP